MNLATQLRKKEFEKIKVDSEQMINDITILSEGLIKSAQINHNLEDQAQTARAWAEVSNELL